jgi:hypothetical protein
LLYFSNTLAHIEALHFLGLVSIDADPDESLRSQSTDEGIPTPGRKLVTIINDQT